MSLCTDGERRALSDFADVIINDTDDGVNLVVENRDAVTYILNFNFSQTPNLTLEVKGRTMLTDDMKCHMEVPSKGLLELGDFHVIDEDVTSLLVTYRVQVLVRNPKSGLIERCPTARNQELDVPPLRFPLTPQMDLVAKQTPQGYVTYIENKGPAAHAVVDFTPSTNAEVAPLSKLLQQPSPLIASINVPANATIEFAEVCPAGRGPFKLAVKGGPSGAPKPGKMPRPSTETGHPSTPASLGGAAGGAPAPTSNSAPAAKTVPAVASGGGGEEWEEHGAGWDAFDGGEGGDGWDHHDGGDDDSWEQHGGAAQAIPGSGPKTAVGSGAGSSAAPKAPASTGAGAGAGAGAAGPGAGAGARGPAHADMLSEAAMLRAFANLKRDFGPPGPHDNGPDAGKWSIYKLVLKAWEEERLARIRIEAEWKVRFGVFIRQWHESVCNICRKLLVSGTKTDIVPYKEYRLHRICYENAEKCNMCNEILVGEYVIAKGVSGKDATRLHTACIEAYKKKTRPFCGGCGKQILDAKWANAGGKSFHFACQN